MWSISRLNQHYRKLLFSIVFILCPWMCCLCISVCSTCKASGVPDLLGLYLQDLVTYQVLSGNETHLLSFSSQCSSLSRCLFTCAFIEKLFDLLIKVYFVIPCPLSIPYLLLPFHVIQFQCVLESMYKYKNKIC